MNEGVQLELERGAISTFALPTQPNFDNQDHSPYSFDEAGFEARSAATIAYNDMRSFRWL